MVYMLKNTNALKDHSVTEATAVAKNLKKTLFLGEIGRMQMAMDKLSRTIVLFNIPYISLVTRRVVLN